MERCSPPPMTSTLNKEIRMKNVYFAPTLECRRLSADEAIAEDPNSFPYNDGELGWT